MYSHVRSYRSKKTCRRLVSYVRKISSREPRRWLAEAYCYTAGCNKSEHDKTSARPAAIHGVGCTIVALNLSPSTDVHDQRCEFRINCIQLLNVTIVTSSFVCFFAEIMQTTFKYGNTQNISSNPNDTWNGFPCHHMWRHKLLNIVQILWSTLYSQYIHTVFFGFLHSSFFYSCVQFIFINLYSCNNCSLQAY